MFMDIIIDIHKMSSPHMCMFLSNEMHACAWFVCAFYIMHNIAISSRFIDFRVFHLKNILWKDPNYASEVPQYVFFSYDFYISYFPLAPALFIVFTKLDCSTENQEEKKRNCLICSSS